MIYRPFLLALGFNLFLILLFGQPSGSLVLYFPFNGAIEDQGGQGNRVEAFNTFQTTDRFGQSNHALQLKGLEEGYIKIPHHHSINLDQEMTIATWFYYEPQTTNSFHTLIEKTNPDFEGHSRYGMWVYNGGTIEICIEPDLCPNGNLLCQRCLDAADKLEENTWYHITGTYDGSALKVYINGILNAEREFIEATGISQTNFEAFIGTDPYDPFPNYLTGRLDDLRVYSKALDAGAIQMLSGVISSDQQKIQKNCIPKISISQDSWNLQIQANCDIRHYSLYRMNGQKVIDQICKLLPASLQINTKGLDSGIYIISIIDQSGHSYAKKFFLY